jgi:hypothetical protein
MRLAISGSVIGLVLLLASTAVRAAPVGGIYNSTDLGGSVLTGRASTWRSGVDSGLPYVLHAQSWNGATLGTQWEFLCATENANFNVQDNRVGGVGTIVYTSTFTGGTFTLFAGGWPWGDGTGTLGTTTLITTVQYILIGAVSTPVAAVVNGITFVIGNGVGVGETTSLNPLVTKPADYPSFLDGACVPPPADQEFGSWGNVITITMGINCPTGVTRGTWGGIKTIYR